MCWTCPGHGGAYSYAAQDTFSYTPYSCRKWGRVKKHKRKDKISETRKGVVNHGVEISNEELYVDDMALKRDNIRERKPQQQKSPPNDNGDNECSSLWSVDSNNVNEIKNQEKTNENIEEIVVNVSNLC